MQKKTTIRRNLVPGGHSHRGTDQAPQGRLRRKCGEAIPASIQRQTPFRQAPPRPRKMKHPSSSPVISQTSAGQVTLLFLKDSTGYLGCDYWLEAGVLHYVTPAGQSKLLPLGRLDLATVKLNLQRNVEFVLQDSSPDMTARST